MKAHIFPWGGGCVRIWLYSKREMKSRMVTNLRQKTFLFAWIRLSKIRFLSTTPLSEKAWSLNFHFEYSWLKRKMTLEQNKFLDSREFEFEIPFLKHLFCRNVNSYFSFRIHSNRVVNGFCTKAFFGFTWTRLSEINFLSPPLPVWKCEFSFLFRVQ